MMDSQHPTRKSSIGAIDFGRFTLDISEQTLYRDGVALPLGARAFGILATLLAAEGQLVTKDALMDAVWPDTQVEEGNIYVHLSALRRILGADRDLIVTIPGRGYQLRQLPRVTQEPAPTRNTSRYTREVSTYLHALTGRDATIQQIRALLLTTPVLTLVGAGGIGKTSLAVEIARQMSHEHFSAVHFVELATATTSDSVLLRIAGACGVPSLDTAVAVPQLVATLADQPALLVLDNAEHVVDAVAPIVDALVAECNHLRVLVTSRESLRVLAETVYRVEPLDTPAPHATVAEILQCSAVKLFLRRVNNLQHDADASDDDLHLVAEICRSLDGLPLAIELAAARVTTLGLSGVHHYLHDRFSLLTGGYRTALPRHQTLRATFDWSLSTLNPCHQLLFRRLSIFSGSFTFDAICAVVCDETYAAAKAIDGITDLVAKSLVNIEPAEPVSRYRLSESTRAYAREKLHAEGEQTLIAVRHARYLCAYLQQSHPTSAAGQSKQCADLQPWLDDARIAFDWAFSARGDVHIGVELAASLGEALRDARQIAESCARAQRAIAALEALPSDSVEASAEARLRTLLAAILPYAQRPMLRQEKPIRPIPAPGGAARLRIRNV